LTFHLFIIFIDPFTGIVVISETADPSAVAAVIVIASPVVGSALQCASAPGRIVFSLRRSFFTPIT
jgi:hypothetical protein